jgi:N-acetylmuramoyl-L-alanine amidase
MPNRYLALFTLLVFLFLPTLAKADMSVDDLRFGLHGEKNRLVLEFSQEAPFKVFTLSNPNRLVIDTPRFNWKPAKIDNINGSFITSIRQGSSQGNASRIVLDSDRPLQIYNAYSLAASNGAKPRLVIDYGRVLKAEDAAKSFGTFSPSNALPVETVTTTTTTTITTAPIPIKKLRKPIIIIDPGHGGEDPGAIGKAHSHSVREKDITISLSRRLRDALNATGRYDARMTRDNDRFIKLYDRVAIARQLGGDLFISIHADSIGRSNVNGASIYTLSDTASDAETAKLAARENKADLIGGIDLGVEDKEVADILIDLVRRDTMNQSKFFANTIVSSFNRNGVKTLERPHRYAGFAVLKAPDIPSVLIESGFVSNPQEAALLTQADYQDKIARAIQSGVDEYFQKLALAQ